MKIIIKYQYNPTYHLKYWATSLVDGHPYVQGAANFEDAREKLLDELTEVARGQQSVPPDETVEL